MQVAVVDLLPKPVPRVVDVGPVPDVPFRRLLYVPVPQHVELAGLQSHLRQLPAMQRRAADAFVLRPQLHDVARLMSDRKIVDDVRHRLGDRPGFVLSPGVAAHELTPLDGRASDLAISVTAKLTLLRALRRAETALLLELPGAVLPDAPDIHYAGPNGRHYRSFARPGLALRTMEGLDAVSFWLREHTHRPGAVLMDSWSMLSLGLKLKLLAGERVQNVDTLRHYDEPADLVLGRLLDENGRVPQRLLLILSVSSTGTLSRRLREACRNGGCREITVVSLFGANSCDPALAGDVFCPLGPEFTPTSAADCDRCKVGAGVVVNVEPTSYLMEVSATAKQARITGVTAQQAKEFLGRYRGFDYLTVHRDQHDKQRHHMVHVDVARLTEHPTFQERVRATTRPLQGLVDAILTPDHPAARRLADLVRSSLGLPPERLVVGDDHGLHALAPSDRRTLDTSRAMLIVDDVVITGDRFWSYRNSLERNRLTSPDREIHFLVGVERTPSNETLQGVRDAAHGAPHFHAVDALTLPNWDQDECPWCWELARLKQFEEELAGEPAMRARYEFLRRSDRGLDRDLFLHWGDDGVRPSRLGPGSVYGQLDREVEVFAGVASAIQRLRSEKSLSEQFTPPAARILNPELTVVGRYYASVLIASTLRGTRRHDLRSTATDARLKAAFDRRLRGGGVRELRSELLFAMARGHVPFTDAAIADGKFFDGAEGGVRKFLRRLSQLGGGFPAR